jgi:hypothetical protein
VFVVDPFQGQPIIAPDPAEDRCEEAAGGAPALGLQDGHQRQLEGHGATEEFWLDGAVAGHTVARELV